MRCSANSGPGSAKTHWTRARRRLAAPCRQSWLPFRGTRHTRLLGPSRDCRACGAQLAAATRTTRHGCFAQTPLPASTAGQAAPPEAWGLEASRSCLISRPWALAICRVLALRGTYLPTVMRGTRHSVRNTHYACCAVATHQPCRLVSIRPGFCSQYTRGEDQRAWHTADPNMLRSVILTCCQSGCSTVKSRLSHASYRLQCASLSCREGGPRTT